MQPRERSLPGRPLKSTSPHSSKKNEYMFLFLIFDNCLLGYRQIFIIYALFSSIFCVLYVPDMVLAVKQDIYPSQRKKKKKRSDAICKHLNDT